MSNSGFQARVHLSTLTLTSFIFSFIIARTFTSFYPSVVLVTGGLHIHHFWFGLVLLVVGGWLGISSNQKEIEMLAAIIYGVGGGLVADEVGLLLTFGNYYSELTYTFMLLLLSFITVLFLFGRYRQKILDELHEFISTKISLYLGVFLAAISVAFVLETDSLLVVVGSASSVIVGILIALAFLIHRIRQNYMKPPKNELRQQDC